ncbi:Uroporphyrinogen-III synthase [Candidatus Purcelliella pentastirinorum]|uniref:Uroporphyrinogen-III synthase n=1 Tax=Candidatus Purcelliella pentastirinorum TaxID=472834 RepID=A0A346DZX3_9ENTR|nr:uroporphyrinogen-III synthase [Candidatus Purcelliella pentastirinorum]AXN02278.1 Uroporphyrinogen-III synthase [Candidatus Purcelliella pentastirinorum]
MTILILRPHPYGKKLAKKLSDLGFNTYNLPLIKFKEGKNLKLLPKIFTSLKDKDLIFVLSQQTIKYVNNFLKKLYLTWPMKPTYYAIGKNTALKLKKKINKKINYPKNIENMETLIDLLKLHDIKKKTALILQSNNSRKKLIKKLKKNGTKIISIECYKQIKNKINKKKERKKLKKHKIKEIVATSKKILKKLYKLIPPKDRIKWLLNCKIIVISKRLAKIAYKLGWKKIYISDKANNNSLIKILKKIIIIK